MPSAGPWSLMEPQRSQPVATGDKCLGAQSPETTQKMLGWCQTLSQAGHCYAITQDLLFARARQPAIRRRHWGRDYRPDAPPRRSADPDRGSEPSTTACTALVSSRIWCERSSSSSFRASSIWTVCRWPLLSPAGSLRSKRRPSWPCRAATRLQVAAEADQIRRSRIRTSVSRYVRLASSRWSSCRTDLLRSRSRL